MDSHHDRRFGTQTFSLHRCSIISISKIKVINICQKVKQRKKVKVINKENNFNRSATSLSKRNPKCPDSFVEIVANYPKVSTACATTSVTIFSENYLVVSRGRVMLSTLE